MERYVGLDESLKQTSICVVNQAGSVMREGVVDSDPEAIAAYAVSLKVERPTRASRMAVNHDVVGNAETPSKRATLMVSRVQSRKLKGAQDCSRIREDLGPVRVR